MRSEDKFSVTYNKHLTILYNKSYNNGQAFVNLINLSVVVSGMVQKDQAPIGIPQLNLH